MSSRIFRTLPSPKSLWVYMHRKALATFRVAQDSHLVLIVALNSKLNWDLVKHQVSGLLETACRLLFHVDVIWLLILSSSNNAYVAIKILTGYATGLNHEHKLCELEVLQCLSLVAPEESYDHCAHLSTHFIHPGIEDDGEHLCLVMELFSSTIQHSLNALQGGFLPILSVKQILRHLLLGIAHLHKCGIVHTSMFAS